MYGTHSILDQLSLIRNQTAIEYGETRLADDFGRFIAAQNLIVDQMTSELVEPTDVRLTSYGIGARMDMIRADEFTRADAQKMKPTTADIGFPLDLFQITLQWTRRFLMVASVADLAVAMQGVREADLRRVRLELQRAFFKNTNDLTYVDRFIDGVTLPIRALYNADSAPIPEDEFGNTFNGATHTHYVGYASGAVAAADINTLITNVVEHGVSGNVRLYINRANEAAITGFANFIRYPQPLTEPGPGSTADRNVAGTRLQPWNIYNRAIGTWNGEVEVWVKPWVIANYVVALDIDPANRVLRWRRRAATGNGALRLVADDEKYPLRAETSEREFGVSVWSRSKAAVLYTGGTSYVMPTIA
jgi:hypothetical protein